MNYGDYLYIWQAPDWPQWRYDLAVLARPLAEVSRAQGLLLGRLADVGASTRDQASLLALTDDVVNTSEIEGEHLNVASVRSSIARRLGVDIGALAPVDRHVEGVVEMVLDATANCGQPVTDERLFGWHAALFPTGYSGMARIKVAAWRNDATGPMQVISGPVGRQKVHFEAPHADRLPSEMAHFLDWLNADSEVPPLLKAGLGHLWFVTLHPFDDGNGRIARAVGDLLLARADGTPQRFYSLSAQIQRDRKAYYEILERTQKGDMDVTDWLVWFLESLHRALDQAHQTLDVVLTKARFWQRWAAAPLNERQAKVLNRLLDGFDGKLTSSKWAAISKCSADTALRDTRGRKQRWDVLRDQASSRNRLNCLWSDARRSLRSGVRSVCDLLRQRGEAFFLSYHPLQSNAAAHRQLPPLVSAQFSHQGWAGCGRRRSLYRQFCSKNCGTHRWASSSAAKPARDMSTPKLENFSWVSVGLQR